MGVAVTRKRHRFDSEQTAKRNFIDPRSYVTLDGHDFLFGEDCGVRRREVFERDKGLCQFEGHSKFFPFDGPFYVAGQADHIQGGNSGRCWCMHNLQWICYEHHKAKHNREPRLSSIKGIEDNSR